MAKGDSTKTVAGSPNTGTPTPAYRTVVFDLSFAGTDQYKTGGFTITPADLGLYAIFAVIALGAKGYHGAWVAPNLLLHRQTATTGALAEVPDNTDISAVSPIRCLAMGW